MTEAELKKITPVDTSKLTRKQRIFLKEYIRTGNATKAALLAYDCDESTASNIGYENVRKLQLNISFLFDKFKLSDGDILRTHAEALQAKRTIVSNGEIIAEVPDHNVRIKAVDLAYKVKGYTSQDKQPVVAVQFNNTIGNVATQYRTDGPADGEEESK